MISLRSLAIILFTILLQACGGGGGGGGGGAAGGSSAPTLVTSHPIMILAQMPSGGGFNVTLDNGRVYFSNYNTGEVKSVAVTGGEIATHYKMFAAFGNVIHRGNQIFALQTQTAGELLALPDTAVDMSTLSANQNASSRTEDTVNDGTYVYWSEYDLAALTSSVWRIPLTPTGSSPIDPVSGASMDKLIGFTLNGKTRIALDGNKLFVSESGTGNIYKVDLATRQATTLTTAIAAGSTVMPIPLTAASGNLYALINGTTIVQINETNGGKTAITTTATLASRVKSDGNAIYWWETPPPTGAAQLRQYSSQTGLTTNLAIFPGYSITPVYDYDIVGGQVWWLRPDSLGNVLVQHVPVSGGTPTTVTTFNPVISVGSSVSMTPQLVAADATNVYWTSSAGTLTLPQTGGIPAYVTHHDTFPSSITLTSSGIVLGGSFQTGITTIPKTAQPPAPTAVRQTVFPSMPINMTADTFSLYWATENFNPTTSTLSSKLASNGAINNLGTMTGNITRAFPYMNALYFVKQTPTGYTVSYIPSNGGAEVVLISSNGQISDVFVANNIVYVVAGAVYAFNLSSQTLSTLVASRPNANRLYVDSNHVYWTEASPVGSATGGVYRTPLTGGAIETIYSGYPSWEITGDGTRIYWAAGWEILSTNK